MCCDWAARLPCKGAILSRDRDRLIALGDSNKDTPKIRYFHLFIPSEMFGVEYGVDLLLWSTAIDEYILTDTIESIIRMSLSQILSSYNQNEPGK